VNTEIRTLPDSGRYSSVVEDPPFTIMLGLIIHRGMSSISDNEDIIGVTSSPSKAFFLVD
jgi:hypothetical protein